MKRYISFLLAVLMLVTLVPTAALADNEIEEMKASENLKTLIKYWEGAQLKAYKAHPSEEYWTIGYGHYGPDVYEGMEITAEQADAYFEQDIAQFEAAARRINEKYGLNANQNQFDAEKNVAAILEIDATRTIDHASGWHGISNRISETATETPSPILRSPTPSRFYALPAARYSPDLSSAV